jgi:hypothetical protein
MVYANFTDANISAILTGEHGSSYACIASQDAGELDFEHFTDELIYKCHNWFGSLLPFIEEQSIKGQMDFKKPIDQPPNSTLLLELYVGAARCPSDPDAGLAGQAEREVQPTGEHRRLDEVRAETDVSEILAAALDLLLYAADNSDDRDNLSIRLFGALAAARPALLRSRIMLRSNSAMALKTTKKNCPIGVVVSI